MELEFYHPYGVKSPRVWAKIPLPAPPRPVDALFPDTPMEVVSYNDGQGHRDCQISAFIYCRNNIYKFEGKSIPGIALVESENYTKNGKWSNTTYSIRIADGYKFTSKMDNWDSGRKIDEVHTVEGMISQLGIEGVTRSAVQDFLMQNFGKTWFRHCDFVEALDKLYDKGISETMEVVFRATKGTKRQGDLHLILDGEVWDSRYNPMPEKVAVKSIVGDTYTLIVPSETLVEELYEWDYGDDCLQDRGFVVLTGEDGYYAGWGKATKAATGNTPFEGLGDILKGSQI
jgi:hypothetical protein